MNIEVPLIDLIPFRINNLDEFYRSEKRVIDPILQEKEYNQYWEIELSRLIYGIWGKDYDAKKNIGGYRYMTPDHYSFTNYTKIEQQVNGVKRLDFPLIRDYNWFRMYSELVCKGLSGFTQEKKYTFHEVVLKKELNIEITESDKIMLKYSDNLYDKKGKLKKYIDPRKYLYSTHREPTGVPIYENHCINHLEVTTRRLGKTYGEIGVIQHGFMTNNAKSIKDYYSKDTSYTCVFAAPNEGVTTENYDKFFNSYDQLFDIGKFENKELKIIYPNPFWAELRGSKDLNKIMTTRHVQKNTKKEIGANNSLTRVNFDTSASRYIGAAPDKFFFDEVGISNNYVSVNGKIEPSISGDSSRKFGQINGSGTGGETKLMMYTFPAFLRPSMLKCLPYPNLSEPGKPDICLFVPDTYRRNNFRDENGNLDHITAHKQAISEREVARGNGVAAYTEHIEQFPMSHKDVLNSQGSALLPTDKAIARILALPSTEKRLYSFGKFIRHGAKSREVNFIEEKNVNPIFNKNDLKEASEKQLSGYTNIYQPKEEGASYIGVYDPTKDIGGGTSKSVAAILKIFSENRLLKFNIVAESIFRTNTLPASDDIFINMCLGYGALMMPELNLNHFSGHIDDVGMRDLCAPFPYHATNLFCKTEGKFDIGFYIYPDMKKQRHKILNELFLSKIEDGYDEVMIDEIPSEFCLEEVINFNLDDNFDYLAAITGFQLHVKELILTHSFYPKSNFKTNDNFVNFVKSINKLNEQKKGRKLSH